MELVWDIHRAGAATDIVVIRLMKSGDPMNVEGLKLSFEVDMKIDIHIISSKL